MIVNLKLTVLAILFVSVGFALVQGNKDTTYTPEEKAAIKKVTNIDLLSDVFPTSFTKFQNIIKLIYSSERRLKG
jgi:hypothetical protein